MSRCDTRAASRQHSTYAVVFGVAVGSTKDIVLVVAATALVAIAAATSKKTQGVSGEVSGPQIVFDHKPLYRRSVHGSTTR